MYSYDEFALDHSSSALSHAFNTADCPHSMIELASMAVWSQPATGRATATSLVFLCTNIYEFLFFLHCTSTTFLTVSRHSVRTGLLICTYSPSYRLYGITSTDFSNVFVFPRIGENEKGNSYVRNWIYYTVKSYFLHNYLETPFNSNFFGLPWEIRAVCRWKLTAKKRAAYSCCFSHLWTSSDVYKLFTWEA